MQPDRRVLRSPNPTRAIRIFLARNVTEPEVRAAVVSDVDGLLLGGVGDVDLDALSAVGSAVVDGTLGERAGDFGFSRQELHARTLTIGEDTFVLTSLGGPLREGAAVEQLLARVLAA
ncbi:MAG: hypothetical protein IPH07_17960 [Deltaproteobacteria bacterium]|nr:hypothetical protein [Deltaproteobacteria bacterium]MBK8238704.1 hypothetical protein [Deltaproteobacteria bacterium]MBK8715585.1 hypothetical protein [Deltaproteobacteria bacterium]MBP7287187.1 hypothetical protein [Nannocystaceae bacterium]